MVRWLIWLGRLGEVGSPLARERACAWVHLLEPQPLDVQGCLEPTCNSPSTCALWVARHRDFKEGLLDMLTDQDLSWERVKQLNPSLLLSLAAVRVRHKQEPAPVQDSHNPKL
ncbi:hypothetical protein VNO77_34229 [Canavalia gladiata]|uniref:Uncharacterized protein n=1 Tax=Canavalia gladiata TaxID=3824 RepID=A0AAN9Q1K9_CANGL